jgi:hypothetical protein
LIGTFVDVQIERATGFSLYGIPVTAGVQSSTIAA